MVTVFTSVSLFLSCYKVVKVSDATVHARSNISGSAQYELVIGVSQYTITL